MTVPEQRSDPGRELDPIIDELSHRYEGRHSRERVARAVHQAYNDLAAGARVKAYLAVLARHEALDRLSGTS